MKRIYGNLWQFNDLHIYIYIYIYIYTHTHTHTHIYIYIYISKGMMWGMMRGVGGVRKSIHQSWLAKRLGLGLGLLCWGFKRVREEILSEEASTLQIGSVAFPPRQCTSPQLHPSHRLFDQDGHQDSFSAFL